MAVADLIRMVNQIAANFGHLPEDQAASEIATHLRLYWTPRMRSQLLDYEAGGGNELDPIAHEALTKLRALV